MHNRLHIGVVALFFIVAACGSAKTDTPDTPDTRASQEKKTVKQTRAVAKNSAGPKTSKKDDASPNTQSTQKLDPQKQLPALLNPLVTEVTASSHISKHPPKHVLDGINQTAWNARGDKPGSQWLEFKFEKPVEISTIVMTTGWEKISRRPYSLFYGNSRAEKVVLSLDGKQVAVETGSHHIRRLQFKHINTKATHRYSDS